MNDISNSSKKNQIAFETENTHINPTENTEF